MHSHKSYTLTKFYRIGRILMYQINFNKPVKIHFMGIGGISMSGLAEILHAKGFTVVGSDAHESAITDHLTSLGIQIAYGQRAENITPDIDVVVYTAAIHPDNPEFAAAKSAGLPMMDRAELLGQIMTNYTNAIAVSVPTARQRQLHAVSYSACSRH
mgnify:CR=1 FL=1